MTKTKVTKREMFEAIKASAEAGAWNVAIDEVIEFCDKEIAALAKKAAKAKETAAKKRAEGDALRDAIEAVITETPQTIADITAAIADEFPEATAAKVSARLAQLVKNETVQKSPVTVEVEGKKCQRMAYCVKAQ